METSPIPVVTVQTAPFDDQRPGTNGLRRKTAVFEGKKNYLQNYVQSVLSSIDLRDRQGCTMVVGSDGRYFSRAATEVIVQMAAANGVRNREGGVCDPQSRHRPTETGKHLFQFVNILETLPTMHTSDIFAC